MTEASPHRKSVRRRAYSPALWSGSALLWLLTIATPLVIGGVHPTTLAGVGLVGACALTFVAIGRGKDGFPVPLAALGLFLGAVAALVSAIPLPAHLVAVLSPHAHALSAFPPEPDPTRIALSLDAPATLVDVPRLAGLAAILLAAAALARRTAQARSLATAVALAGVAVVAVAAVHATAGIHELYGFYPRRADDDFISPFVNGNHAASLMLLSGLACLGLARSSPDPIPRLLWGISSLGCLGFGMTTHSNAGIACIVLSVGAFIILSARRASHGSNQPLIPVRGVVIAVCLAVIAVAAVVAGVLGAEGLGGLIEAGQGKARPWPATLHLIHDSWLTGVGRGAFAAAYPPYAPPRTLRTITHPENIVLQWFAEWGVPAALAGFALLGATIWRAWRKRDEGETELGPVEDALLVGVIGVLLHDLADFGLEFGGVGVPFTVALGVIAGRSAGGRRWRSFPWLVAATAGATALVSVTFGIPHLVDTELAALSRQKGLDATTLDQRYREIRRRHPADPLVVISGGDALLARASSTSLPQEERSTAMELAFQYLIRSQTLSQQEQPHLGLAWALARSGRRSQAFTELRLAFALSANYEAIDQAVAYGATAEELASFPEAVARLHTSLRESDSEFDPAHVAAGIVGYVLAGKRKPWLADEAAQQILHLPPETRVSHSAELLETACRAGFAHGECAAQGRPSCGGPEAVPKIAAQMVEIAREHLAKYPSDPRAYDCYGGAYLLLKANDEVRRVLLSAIAKFPDAPATRLALADLDLREHRPADALTEIDAARIDDPAMAPRMTQLKLSALWAVGRHRQALDDAESATRTYPNAAWAFRMASSIHHENGDLEKAIREAAEAIRLASDGEKPELLAWERRLNDEKERADRIIVQQR